MFTTVYKLHVCKLYAYNIYPISFLYRIILSICNRFFNDNQRISMLKPIIKSIHIRITATVGKYRISTNSTEQNSTVFKTSQHGRP